MNLSFHEQFIKPIIKGTKIHTIREDPHDRWHAGRRIDFCTGPRTSNYKCFKRGVCKSIQKIEIYHCNTYTDPEVWVDERMASDEMVNRLAKNDGFESVADFFKWFDRGDLIGKIIHWTSLRY